MEKEVVAISNILELVSSNCLGYAVFANRDIELCCDRFVTRTLTRKQKQDYARFLVEFQTYVKLPQTGFTGGQLQERIVNLMMKPQKIIGAC